MSERGGDSDIDERQPVEVDCGLYYRADGIARRVRVLIDPERVKFGGLALKAELSGKRRTEVGKGAITVIPEDVPD